MVTKIGFLLTLLVTLPLSAAWGRIFVSTTDPTCGGQAPCFSTIQAGVDGASPGEEVSVAAGTYTGVAAVDLSGDVYYQVVMITDSVVLQGGYANDDWSSPDPDTNVTIIDAEGGGRGISVIGDSSHTVTIAGFTVANGNYSDLGNADGEFNVCRRTGSDCAGGLLVRSVEIHIEDCSFEDNVASTTSDFSDGGGAMLWSTASGSRISDTRFLRNQAPTMDGSGGGLWLTSVGDITIFQCDFVDNLAAVRGGGLGGVQPVGLVTIQRARLLDNDADGIGGGGGFAFNLNRTGLALEVDQALILGNESNTFGTGIYIEKTGNNDTTVNLDNMLLEVNEPEFPSDIGSVIDFKSFFGNLVANLRQLTVLDPIDDTAIRATSGGTASVEINVVNTLIGYVDSAFSANETAGELTFNHTNTLTHNVTTLEATESGTPTFTGVGTITGDPLLDTDGFLTEGSPAIDAGVDSGVSHDILGTPRPAGPAFDIGAHEFTEIFYDGFESGDTSVWSSESP